MNRRDFLRAVSIAAVVPSVWNGAPDYETVVRAYKDAAKGNAYPDMIRIGGAFGRGPSTTAFQVYEPDAYAYGYYDSVNRCMVHKVVRRDDAETV